MHINWFTWILSFDDCICYMENLGVTRIIQFSQRNGNLPLPRKKRGNYHIWWDSWEFNTGAETIMVTTIIIIYYYYYIQERNN